MTHFLFNPEFQGWGYATSVVSKSLEIAKHQIGIRRIDQTYVDEQNIASRRVLEKCGFELIKVDEQKHRLYYKKDL